MDFWTEDFDGWIVSRGMDLVGEENDFYFTNGIDPDRGSGEPKVAEGFRGKPLTGG